MLFIIAYFHKSIRCVFASFNQKHIANTRESSRKAPLTSSLLTPEKIVLLLSNYVFDKTDSSNNLTKLLYLEDRL